MGFVRKFENTNLHRQCLDLRSRLGKPASKVSSLLRTKGLTGTIAHCRTVLLHKMHERFIDQRYYAHEKHNTSGKVEINQLTVKSENAPLATHYLPTPRRVLDWIHSALSIDFTKWTFIDMGAGRGRTLIAAAHHPYDSVVGVEFAEELVWQARGNIASYPKELIKASEIKMLHADAATYVPPQKPCVIFLFNPFDASILSNMLTNMMRKNMRMHAPYIIVYLNPQHENVLMEFPELEKCSLPNGLALKMKLFSPYRVAIYRTKATVPHLS